MLRTFLFLALLALALGSNWSTAQAQCANAIVCENALTGNPQSEWDIDMNGDPTIQGYATDISVNHGQTINFKVNTTATSYRIDIYRLGYYNGLGARKVATVNPTAHLPQNQPQCLNDVATGLIDCGNWAVSASWAVPSTAVSGVYIGRLVRSDTGGASHMVFVVRDDTGKSDLLFQTSDTAWQAYNNYGGSSLYGGAGPAPDNRAYKVSYNRPFTTRAYSTSSNPLSFVFSAEYPMIRWLEANGYNISYAAGMDTDRRGSSAITQHKVFLSVGHDEYWSGQQRTNVEAARAAGVHLGFFCGNELFWKTRWENSIDGTNTAFRTLVCYKETIPGLKIDPSSQWTGTWRDPRFSPPSDGGRPENALTGQIFTVNAVRSDPIVVPGRQGQLRFWRNTGFDSLVDGLVGQLQNGVLGYEWDEALDNGAQPAGLARLSTTTIPVDSYVETYGATEGPAIATHSLSLYRYSSGALVFGAGTVQWTWGLDSNHDIYLDGVRPQADWRMQQATVNILADMGTQPATLQPGLTSATASTDTSPPTSVILTPSGQTVPPGIQFTIYGTATDAGGGRVANVDVSLDGGTTWHPAEGGANWSFTWWTYGVSGSVNIKSRAVDDSGRVETPGGGITVNVSGNVSGSTLFPLEATPKTIDDPDSNATEVGVRFQAEANGWIAALRFYKSADNTGTHIGNLWDGNGNLLASVTFANETPTGWQQQKLNTPVPVVAGTPYIASYHTDVGHFSDDLWYFAGKGVTQRPLSAPADSTTAPNGLYKYGPSTFPSNTSESTNYWVDVVYASSLMPDTTSLVATSLSPTPGSMNAAIDGPITARFSKPLTAATVLPAALILRNAQNNIVSSAIAYDPLSQMIQLTPSSELSSSTTYTATLKGGLGSLTDLLGNPLQSDVVWSFTTAPPLLGPFTLWPASAVPATINDPDSNAIEVGVRFQSSSNGWLTGLRFYKGTSNIGTHLGNLWTTDGTLLATVTFANETSSGWQQQQFPSPVPIIAGASYIASYHTDVGHFSDDLEYFAGTSVNQPPLLAPADTAATPNGAYIYGPSSFPAKTSQSTNYWVDVVFKMPNQATPPTFSPAGGAYTSTQAVTLSDNTSGSQIYYTVDGSAPGISSARYTSPISIATTATIKAIAAASGLTPSSISTATYTIQGAVPPTFSPGAGTYASTQSVTLTSAGATIYYTTDGSTPTTNSKRYSSPISISTPTTIKAIAVLSSKTSSIASAAYAFQAAAPTFNPSGGGFSGSISVTLADSSSGAKIYYTTNGTTPTTSSAVYSSAIAVSKTTTINAIAAVSGWTNSMVSSATYTLSAPTVPAAPAGLSATAVSSSQINLGWSDVANETGFKIERKTGSSGTYAQIATVGSKVVSYSNTGLAAGINYYYRLRATNSSGDSSYSNETNATTLIPGLRGASSASAKSGILTLTVSKPSGTVQGDVMLAAVAIRPSTATITASGWTLVRRLNNSSSNSNSLAIYYKVAASSEPSSYSFIFSTSTGAVGGIRSFTNIDTTNPVDVEGGQNVASSQTLTAPSVTTRYASDIVATTHAFSSSATFTPPTGMTEAFDIASETTPTSAGEAMEGNYQAQTAIGATGTRAAKASNDADAGNADTIALKAR